MKNVIRSILHDRVFIISMIAMLISFLFGTPTLGDIDWHTIFSLLSLMICVQLLSSFQILDYFNNQIIQHSGNKRQAIQLLMLVSFIGSMFLTNDVAILTVIPLTIKLAEQQKFSVTLPATLIVISSNLGSAFTPFGNPQNLFLVSHFHLKIIQFFKISAPLMIVSFLLLFTFSFLISSSKLNATDLKRCFTFPKFTIYTISILFVLVFLSAFNVFPPLVVAIVSVIGALFIDKKALYRVDFGLLLTFICFFIIVGSLKSNQGIYFLLQHLTRTIKGTYLCSLIGSQIISNVPMTILLAHFSSSVNALFLGGNIGGLGSIIASLANILAFKLVLTSKQLSSSLAFLLTFTFYNIMLLFMLSLFGLLLL